ncbi:unnamed protein product [Fraxinus pennsylvanica]|uniref:NAC domain-containing protein n=1 Tax=Fraxinus pennsylvanica TaxID=56036 RepID=A0AAD2ECN0_9LAMI|nr:unnamed protein product [Fraxinus pennsylvanica]
MPNESFEFDLQEEGWVVCRMFMKKMATTRKEEEHESLCWYDDQVSFMPDFNFSRPISQPYTTSYHPHYTCKQELELQYNMPHDAFFQLPELESPKVPQSTASSSIIPCGVLQFSSLGHEENVQQNNQLHISEIYSNDQAAVDQVTDWRVLDKFVASQLSQDDATNDNAYSTEPSDQLSDQNEHNAY